MHEGNKERNKEQDEISTGMNSMTVLLEEDLQKALKPRERDQGVFT